MMPTRRSPSTHAMRLVGLALASAGSLLVGCDLPGVTIESDTAAPDTASDTNQSDTRVDTAVAPDTDTDTTPDTDTALDTDTTSDADTGVDTAPPPDTTPPPSNPEACKIPFNNGMATGIGFPTADVRLDSVGTVRATVLFVEFADVAADLAPEDVFVRLSPGAEEFFATNSYGRMQLELTPHLEWLTLSQTAAHYGASLTSFVDHRAWIVEAVQLADPAVDFSQTDLLVIVSTPNATDIEFGPTYMGVPGWEITADGHDIYNGMTSGYDLNIWGSQWLNHEAGHTMSLPDLYDYSQLDGFTRPFSAMDLINSEAAEFLAWERWQLGWLDDEQVICEPGDAELTLTPIETPGGTKAVMFRTSPERVVVAESRRAIGYDSELQREGVVVTLVDATVERGSGPIRVVNDDKQALLPGQSLTVDGVTIEVLTSTDAGDHVRVTAL